MNTDFLMVLLKRVLADQGHQGVRAYEATGLSTQILILVDYSTPFGDHILYMFLLLDCRGIITELWVYF